MSANPKIELDIATVRATYKSIEDANDITGWCICCRQYVDEDDGIITHDPACAFCELEMQLAPYEVD